MFLVTKVMVYMRALIAALLGCFTAVPGAALLATPKLRLMQNRPTVTEDLTIAEITECDFDGYAAVAIAAWSGPVNYGDRTQAIFASGTFTLGGTPGAGQAVQGYYLTDTTGTILYGAEVYDTPVNLVNTGDFVEQTILLPLQSVQTA